MVSQHDAEGFGGCTNIGECTVSCPKEIPLDVIATLNHDYLHASTGSRRRTLTPDIPRPQRTTAESVEGSPND
jgi:succinate dehydrogenase / fumarate reductase iron-sulfur subunit